MKNLHIVISSDENYIKHAAVLSNSIIKHNKESFFINIHLLSNNVTVESQDKLKIFLDTDCSSLHIYDLSDIKKKIGIKIPDTISITSYLRLFIGSILPNTIDKVIYMDVDAVVNHKLNSLWDVSFESQNELIAGVLDSVSIFAKKMIDIDVIEPYLNAGLILINLKLWREENLQQKFVDFLHKKNGDVFHHDQGIINAICNKRKKVLHPKFNVMTSFFDFTVDQIQAINKITPYYTQNEIDEAKVNPVYIHFTPSLSNRPWMVNSLHPLKNLYIENLKDTPWHNVVLDPDTRKLRIKFLTWTHRNLPFFFYVFIIKFRSVIYQTLPFIKKISKAK